MIGLGLLDIAATTFDLPKIEERWPEERGYGKIIYAQEWHNLMGALSYLTQVVPYLGKQYPPDPKAA